MAVGVEIEEIPEGLDGNDGSGDCTSHRDHGLKKHFQRVSSATAQPGEEFSIIEKVSPEDLWYAEGEVAMGNRLQDLSTEPFSEFHNTLLMTGWTEMPSFA